MKCPVCDDNLKTINKFDCEIDICPGCKGVWLDRGELEKILEVAESGGPARQSEPDRNLRPPVRDEHREHHDDDHREKHHDHDDNRDYRVDNRDYRDDRQGKGKKRSSWISDILGSIGGGED